MPKTLESHAACLPVHSCWQNCWSFRSARSSAGSESANAYRLKAVGDTDTQANGSAPHLGGRWQGIGADSCSETCDESIQLRNSRCFASLKHPEGLHVATGNGSVTHRRKRRRDAASCKRCLLAGVERWSQLGTEEAGGSALHCMKQGQEVRRAWPHTDKRYSRV